MKFSHLLLLAPLWLSLNSSIQCHGFTQFVTPSFISQKSNDREYHLASVAVHSVAPSHKDQPEVAKTGGRGEASTSQMSVKKSLNLGSPQGRPSGGHYLTRGGVQITSHITPLEYSTTATANGNIESSANKIEELVDRLDKERGVLLTSSYEFPGRYKRWSMGFVNPPLEISGRESDCKIVALNDRGKIMIPAVIRAMNDLVEQGILESVDLTYENGDEDGDVVKVQVKVKAMSEVGSFSEEDRSRQVSFIYLE